ncbi:MAG TPA: hypothetical protein VKZ75_02385 [Cyclobacteriaceae bacterium]|nr:hypothetical protein [Cyclobacteriaceae bacterium]
MYEIFLDTHSYLRYFVLIMLIVVIVKSFMGWTGAKPYTRVDDRLGLYLVIFAHLQLVAGIVLYFMSPYVQFGSQTMKEATVRYWTVEHSFMMVIAIVLITAARSTSRRMQDDTAKQKRLVIFNIIALVVIVGALIMSGRGILGTAA